MNPLTWMLFKRVWGIVAPVRSIPQVYLQEYCALLLLSMIQVRVTIAALSKHGGGSFGEEVHHPVQRLADARLLVATCSQAVKDPKFPGKLSMHPVPATWRWQLAFTALQ